MSSGRKLAFTFSTLILAFLFLEAAVRLTNYDMKRMVDLYDRGEALYVIQIPDAFLLWRNKPGERLPLERVNARGFRGPLPTSRRGAQVRRIAVLGDSGTFGILQTKVNRFEWPIPYPARLQEILDRNLPHLPFEVLNYGVIGYTSYQGLRLLRREVLEDDPDFVVIRFGWNDHLRSSYGRSFSSAKNALSEAVESLLYKSRLVAMLLFPRSAIGIQNILAPSSGGGPVVWVDPDDYAYNLERMIALTRNHGASPILIDAPAAPMGPELRPIAEWFAGVAGYGSYESLLEAHAAYQAITERVAREKRVHFVKTTDSYVAGESRPMFSPYDIAHPSQAGHDRIANRLYAEIAARVMRESAAAD